MAGGPIRVDAYELPLSRPLETARGTLETREGYLVRVETDGEPAAETLAGADRTALQARVEEDRETAGERTASNWPTGLGEAAPLPAYTESREACEAALDEAAGVAAAAGLEEGHDSLDATSTPAAVHGLATATLDVAAKAVDQPLYRLLGGEYRETVPVNAVVGDGTAAETAETAAAAVDAGFDCVKVKVGAREPSADTERLEAVRAAVGPDVALRADANGAWTRREAERALEDLASLDLEYVEQPLPPGNLEGLASLRTESVPVAIDEGLTVADVDEVIAAEAADAVVLKPMAHGSPATARAVATSAIEAGLSVTVTTTIDAVVARTAAVHVAASLPSVAACGLATADRLAADLGPDPAPVTDGAIAVPQAAGLGLEEVST